MRRAAPPSCTVTCGQTTGQGWRLAVPGRDVMIRDWRGKAEDRHCIDRSPAGQHPIDGDSEGGLRSRAVCMKDPGPDRTARSELDDLRASATYCGLGGRIRPQIAWAKLDTLVKGAELATSQLWG
jgi:hypothetical protein